MPEARIPRATYRLQLHRDFGFDDALRIVPYLARLGVSHIYCSPILRARPGSAHGYDIVAHDEINPELGGREGFDRFVDALHRHGMGLLLDMVPNHMGVLGADNAWWMDVLENGPASIHARCFDIDWHPVNSELEGKLLVPVLGDHYGRVLDAGELRLAFEPEAGVFSLRYYAHRFPLDPRSYPRVLEPASRQLGDQAARAPLLDIAAALAHLPPRESTEASALALRHRDKETCKERLATLAAQSTDAARAIDAAIDELNGAAARDALHALLELQAWRLAFWRVAADEINYRRFFDISDLAALRMEDPQVFEDTHGFILDLAAAGAIDGLRIDHPDGLHDPAQYFRRLQEAYARRAGIGPLEPDVQGRPARPLYVVAEKITAPYESLPEHWPVHGTTGYRFAMLGNGVLVDASVAGRIDRTWRSFTGEQRSFIELAWQSRRDIMRSALASELTLRASELLRLARADRRTRDYTFNTLRQALAEVAACMPVYRTYVINGPSPEDLRYIDWAITHARQRSRAADTSIFDFVRQSLLGQTVEGVPDALVEQVRGFAQRFQQFTAPVMAKGVEDTAFYRYPRLASLCEVGGDPQLFGVALRTFHRANRDRAARWPHTILATSTHDSKRSEDVRCRIDVLSELPAAWRLALRRWRTMNRSHRSEADGGTAPSPVDEYLLYQTLLGTLPQDLDESTLPAYRERIEAYMLKAAREAKARTSWVSPDEHYEHALSGFVNGLLRRLQPNPFLDDLRPLAETVRWFGALNGLSLTLLKLTAPGVPDIYQGNEIIDLSLVDPDNRRPVDFALRSSWLEELTRLRDSPEMATEAQRLATHIPDGRAKLWLTSRLLTLRRQQPQLFSQGHYRALRAEGEFAQHVIAYSRSEGGQTLIVIAGRLFADLLGSADRLPLADVWTDTRVAVPRLPVGCTLTDVLTGERHRMSDAGLALSKCYANFPACALLTAGQ